MVRDVPVRRFRSQVYSVMLLWERQAYVVAQFPPCAVVFARLSCLAKLSPGIRTDRLGCITHGSRESTCRIIVKKPYQAEANLWPTEETGSALLQELQHFPLKLTPKRIARATLCVSRVSLYVN